MTLRLPAYLGIIILAASLAFFAVFRQDINQARNLDEVLENPNLPERPGPCLQLLADVAIERRVMTDRESQALTIDLHNENNIDCTTDVAVHAPDFRTSPLENTLTVEVPAGSRTQLVWILSPRRSGTYQVAVAVGGEAELIGLSVTNVLGLTVAQAQIVSLFGTILGPMLTLPWWIGWWRRRRSSS